MEGGVVGPSQADAGQIRRPTGSRDPIWIGKPGKIPRVITASSHRRTLQALLDAEPQGNITR